MQKGSLLVTFLVGVGILTSIIFFIAANISNKPEYCVVYLTILCVTIVLFCLEDFSKKSAFFFFYLCFYTFLVSGATLPYLRGRMEWKKGFSDSDYMIACNCLLLSTIFMTVGYLFADKIRIKYIGKAKEQNIFAPLKKLNLSTIRLQKISFYVFIVTTLAATLLTYREMRYVMKNGYMSKYVTPNLKSSWGIRFALSARASFFIVLSTWPGIKMTLIVLILGTILQLMDLAEGGRAGIVLHCVFSVFYLCRFREFNFLRTSKKENRKRFIRLMLVATLVAVLALPWLHSYGHTRAGLDYEKSDTILGRIFDFFEEEGTSFILVGYASQFKGQLHKAYYSLGYVADYFMGPYKDKVERALLGNQFADTVTYMLYPDDFVNGYGLGSSYVAELYYDFGYMGVCIINLIIGRFLRKMTQYEKKSILQRAIMFQVFYNMVFIPRGTLLGPLVTFGKTSIAVWIVCFYLSRKRTISGVGLSRKGECVT